jgi:hypothetical protein
MDSARGLVGAGPSQVGPGGAMRVRDVSRPRPEHVAAAEELDTASGRGKRRRAGRAQGRAQPGAGVGSSPVSS